MIAWVKEAHDISNMSHREMFEKLNSMSDDELGDLRHRALYVHKGFMAQQAEKAAYADVVAISILRTRGRYI